MSISTRKIRPKLLLFLALMGVCFLLPALGYANVAFQEEWVYTSEAQIRTADGDCDPDETCLELCLTNPQTGVLIRRGEFQCFAN